MSSVSILEKIAQRLRIHSLQMTTAAGSGHPSTCLSCAEIMACLFFHEMRYNPNDPEAWENDEFVLSKGHAAPILWAAYAEAGIIPEEELLNLRKIDSVLEGHPTPRMPWVKAATGSLGQGLSIGVGLALAQKLAGVKARTFVLLGDGECAEGAVWEAANAGREFKLGNLVAIVDVNRLGQSEPTMHQHDLKAYAKKFKAFGWDVYQVDGHKIEKLLEVLAKARLGPKPKVILARTVKGKGVSFIEDKNGWHGKPLKPEELEKALAELGPRPEIEAKKYVRSRPKVQGPKWKDSFEFELSSYKDKTATRLAYGLALEKLGRVNDRVVVIDGDVKNSTYTDKFFSAFPNRAFESYIAEQNMIGLAIGLAAKGFLPFAATFAAFLTRAHDQIRMAAYSFSNIKLCGSHVGVSIGEDGPSQMGLEDLAMFLPIPGCTVLYPSDGVSTEKCVKEAARHRGMVYIRTTRPATPILYAPEEEFPIGGSKVVKKSEQDAATVIAAGITVHEALRAAELLEKEGINIRVIDAYSVKPLDSETIIKSAGETGGRVVVVEDHFEQGGLGTAVALILPEKKLWKHLCIRDIPRSGRPEELMAKYGIDAGAIAAAVKSLLT
ncbi:MAG TPA: transketolase [Candidatus Saccharicenans sp.]|nr:transketolase [Candidatus Saccharicenans sp.]HQE63884.1 transketolase [Candidatus Saccharicenans sp.]HQH61060.1 transketolase [Candidatus Saccharicenans sp.]HQI22573.1 transketolase [Candidatus Saccharicenans sp.]